MHYSDKYCRDFTSHRRELSTWYIPALKSKNGIIFAYVLKASLSALYLRNYRASVPKRQVKRGLGNAFGYTPKPHSRRSLRQRHIVRFWDPICCRPYFNSRRCKSIILFTSNSSIFFHSWHSCVFSRMRIPGHVLTMMNIWLRLEDLLLNFP